MSKFKTTVLIFGFILMGFSGPVLADSDGSTNAFDTLRDAEKKADRFKTCFNDQNSNDIVGNRKSYLDTPRKNSGESTEDFAYRYQGIIDDALSSLSENENNNEDAVKRIRDCYYAGESTESNKSLPASCSEDIKSYNEQKRELSRACSKAGMRANLSSCVDESFKCTQCQGFESSQYQTAQEAFDEAKKNDGDIKSIRSELESKESSYDSTCGDFGKETATFFDSLVSGRSVGPTTLNSSYDSERKRMVACPTLAGEGLDDFRDEVEDYKKRRDDLVERVSDLQREADELKTEIEELTTGYENQVSTDAEEFEKTQKDLMEQITDGMEEEEAQVLQEINNTRNQVNDKIREKELEIEQTRIAAKNERSNILRECYAQSQQKVASDREREMTAIRNKNFKVATAGALFSRAGVTSDDVSNARMDNYTAKCMSSSVTKLSLNEVKETFFLTMRSLNEQKAIYQRQLGDLDKAWDDAKKNILKKKGKLLDQFADNDKQYKKDQERKKKIFINELKNKNRRLYGDFVPQSEKQAANVLQSLSMQLNPDNPNSSSLAARAGVMGQLAYAKNRLTTEENYVRDKESFLAFRTKASTNKDPGTAATVNSEIIGVQDTLGEAVSSCECCTYSTENYSETKRRRIKNKCDSLARAYRDLGKDPPCEFGAQETGSKSGGSSSGSSSVRED